MEQLNSDAPKAIIKQKSRVSKIWLLPLIAFIIGAGMVYQQWQNRGVEIIIEFENAQSLEVKKTKVKFRNVDIGVLKDIRFTQGGSAIAAVVEIEKNMQEFLRSDSQFWVVRPRVGSGGVSGFSTLFSGAYITVDPGLTETFSTRFKGLEKPPFSSPTDEGIKLKLVSTGGKSLKEGNPVIYRGFEVGAVEAVDFNIESRKVTYNIFIRAPYDGLITSNTFFWNSGGVSITTNSQGLSVDLGTVESFLAGGVQFDVPEDLSLGQRITQSQEFTLYSSRSSIYDDRQYEYLEYVILVEDSIGGLAVGAPVEYRGLRIGSVYKPYLGFHQTNQVDFNESRIPVIIHVEPARLAPNLEYDMAWFDNQFNQWLEQGLVAKLETANYLTGALKVNLDLTNEPPTEIEQFGNYKVIPIAQGGFASIISKTEALLSKLNSLPIEDLVTNANTAILSANDTVLATQSVLGSVEETMREAKLTLQGLQPDSPMYQKLENNLNQLERTLNMMQPFLQEIRRKPSSLIFSDEPSADIQPKGKSQ